MSSTAGRVLRATAAAIGFVVALAACENGATGGGTAESPPAATPTAAGSSAPAPDRTPAVVAPKDQRQTDPTGPNPCDGVARRGGTGPMQLEPHATGELYLVRVERTACADLVVFQVDGTARFGGHAEYVARARAARSGDPIEVRGGAVLEVVVFAPDFAHAGSGHQPGRVPWWVGDEVASVPGGWSALREVAYAGPNDGSETVFAVGVRQRLPFTLAWRAGDGFSELSVEVAHRE
ncbi:AMIN-like domain-containing (lipo)protein [Phytohabitans suffuscus]|uniref:AMIN-like domain-containing (lipo)protein n=1 Tax=Phytohabitans suffuscus TaxID=624315 RepID=UPI0015636257|nr:hypothetical protein [Phytohabitans suffuscus]